MKKIVYTCVIAAAVLANCGPAQTQSREPVGRDG